MLCGKPNLQRAGTTFKFILARGSLVGTGLRAQTHRGAVPTLVVVSWRPALWAPDIWHGICLSQRGLPRYGY
jgi:hypothetical protein